jgi:cytidylate kinase
MHVGSIPSIIAIDGTAASGKTTVGKVLAKQLGHLYFDTGAMYRGVTWATLQRGTDPADEAGVVAVAESLKLDVVPTTVDDGRPYSVFADGEDITWQIREAAVEAHVSQVSTYPGVRAALTTHQRRVALRGNVVMVGRDIGTVVLPEADLKLYFNASVEVRARRRWLERRERGEGDSNEAILEAMRLRDKIDSQREHAPMRPAADAIRIDTSDMTIEEVQAHVLSLLKNLQNNPG